MTAALEFLKTLPGYDPKILGSQGVCAKIIGLEGWKNALSLMDEWPEHSGDDIYPVPHPDLEPDDAYHKSDAYEKWNPDHPYGAARWRLIKWLIEQLEKEGGDA